LLLAANPRPTETATDLSGDPLPAGARARLGTERWRHSDTIAFVAFLPDGKQVVTASNDGSIRLWDRDTGKVIRRFDRPARSSTKPLPGNDQVQQMRMARLALLNILHGGTRGFHAAVAPDGKTLAALLENNTVQMWDVATGQPRQPIAGPPTG